MALLGALVSVSASLSRWWAANICTNDDCEDTKDVFTDVERNAVDAAEADAAECISPTSADGPGSDRLCKILSIISSFQGEIKGAQELETTWNGPF